MRDVQDYAEMLERHCLKHKCEKPELQMVSERRWRIVIICVEDPTKSGTGLGANPREAHQNLCEKLGLIEPEMEAA